MKILCISDQIDPLVYSFSIKERFADVDMILCAGDLPLDYLDFIISNLNKPLLFVFGNHHTKDMKYFKREAAPLVINKFEEFPGCGAIYVGSKIRTIENKFIVAGLGGSMSYNKGPNQFTEFEMFFEIIKLVPHLLWNRIFHGRFCDILLTHAPPKGIHDQKDKCHSGFKCYLTFMKIFKPRFLVHGHIHLYDLSAVRVTQFETTTVINAYNHFVIDLGV